MTVTCDEFLTDVKRLITVPSNQSLLNDADLLALGTNVMRIFITPMIDSANQEFFITSTPPISIEANKASYPIPARAVGRKLRDLKLYNGSGQFWSFPMVGITRSQMFGVGEIPFGFRFEGDRIVVMPTPTSATDYFMKFYYAIRPGKFVRPTAAAIITSISGDDITVDNLPMTFTANRRIDVIQGEQGNWYHGTGLKILNVTGNTLTLEAGQVPEDTEEGDYIALTGESPVVQIPEDLYPILVSKTCSEVLQAISDFDGKKIIDKDVEEQKAAGLKLIQPRADSKPTVLVNPYGISRGRGRRNFTGLWRG